MDLQCCLANPTHIPASARGDRWGVMTHPMQGCNKTLARTSFREENNNIKLIKPKNNDNDDTKNIKACRAP